MAITKKHLLVTSGLLILSGGLVFGKKLLDAGKQLKVSIGKVTPQTQLSNFLQVASALQSSLDVSINVLLNNYSKHTYTLDQIQVSLYSPSGRLIAEQVKPLNNSVVIPPSATQTLPISFKINSLSALQTAFEGTSFDDLWNFLSKAPGGLGKKLIAKGTVRAEGFNVAFNEEVAV